MINATKKIIRYNESMYLENFTLGGYGSFLWESEFKLKPIRWDKSEWGEC